MRRDASKTHHSLNSLACSCVFNAKSRTSNLRPSRQWLDFDRVKYWEIIADNLKKAGWSLGYVSAIDSEHKKDTVIHFNGSNK